MSNTVIENEFLEHLDFSFAPACEYSVHDKYGDGPAQLIAHLDVCLCGHGQHRWQYFCDSCWNKRNSGMVRCPENCGTRLNPFDNIIQVVRL